MIDSLQVKSILYDLKISKTLNYTLIIKNNELLHKCDLFGNYILYGLKKYANVPIVVRIVNTKRNCGFLRTTFSQLKRKKAWDLSTIAVKVLSCYDCHSSCSLGVGSRVYT